MFSHELCLLRGIFFLTDFNFSADGSIQVWRTDTWESECVLEGHGRKEEDKDFAAHHEVSLPRLTWM